MKWKPIETAPKDYGTKILAYIDGYNTVDIIQWDGDIWIDSGGDGVGTATHWMPLPNPPNASQQPVEADADKKLKPSPPFGAVTNDFDGC